MDWLWGRPKEKFDRHWLSVRRCCKPESGPSPSRKSTWNGLSPLHQTRQQTTPLLQGYWVWVLKVNGARVRNTPTSLAGCAVLKSRIINQVIPPVRRVMAIKTAKLPTSQPNQGGLLLRDYRFIRSGCKGAILRRAGAEDQVAPTGQELAQPSALGSRWSSTGRRWTPGLPGVKRRQKRPYSEIAGRGWEPGQFAQFGRSAERCLSDWFAPRGPVHGSVCK